MRVIGQTRASPLTLMKICADSHSQERTRVAGAPEQVQGIEIESIRVGTPIKVFICPGHDILRRVPLNVRAVSAKIKLPKKYLQHCHILRTDKKNLSLLLLPS